MLTALSDIIAPHHCSSCGETGAILCQYCKYDIINDVFTQCIVCLVPNRGNGHVCESCKTSYTKAWCAGERHDGLKQLIDAYKFDNVRSAEVPLAEIIDEILPELPSDVVVVGLPTVWKHIRQRGYDHTERIAKRLAHMRGLPYCPAIIRTSNDTQRGSSRKQRIAQAKSAFGVHRRVDGRTCLLLDDVFTTGASAEYAARALKEAGASEVWLAVISRQPLEKS